MRPLGLFDLNKAKITWKNMGKHLFEFRAIFFNQERYKIYAKSLKKC